PRIALGHAVSRRRGERVREAVVDAHAAHAPVPRSAAARDRGESRPAEPGPDRRRSAPRADRRAGARSDPARAAGEHPLLLEVERTDEALSRASVPPGLRARRVVPARLRARVRRGADLRRRAPPRALAARRALRADRGAAGRSVPAFARRPL